MHIDINDQEALYHMALSHSYMASLHVWKGVDSRLLFVSYGMAKITGYNSVEAFIGTGLSDADWRCRMAEMAEQFVHEDQQVIQKQKAIKKLECVCMAGNDWRVLMAQKYPVFDKDQAVQAVGVSLLDITRSDVAILNHGVLCADRLTRYGASQQFSYIVDETPDDLTLTARQQEVVFYLLRGHTAQSIAARLGIGRRTVEDHLCLLKQKTACRSKSQLIENLLSRGYLNMAPQSCITGVL